MVHEGVISTNVPGIAAREGATAEQIGQSLRRVARDGLWAMMAYSSGAASAFLVSIILARALGVSDWGRLSYYIWILRVAPTLIAFGVPVAIAKVVAERVATGDDDVARRLFVLSVRFHAVVMAVLAVAVAIRTWRGGHDPWLPTVVVVGIAVVLVALDAEALLTGLRRFRTWSMFSLAVAGAQVLTAVVGLVAGLSWEGFLALSVALGVVNLVAVLVVCGRALRTMPSRRIERSVSAAFARFAALCGFSLVLDIILWGRPELLFIERYHTDSDVGLYSAALRIASLAALLPHVAARPLLPEFSRLRGQRDHAHLAGLYARACGLLVIVAAPLALIGAATAPAVVRVVYGAEYGSASTAAAILMGSSLVFGLAKPVGAALLTGPHPSFVAKLGAVAVAANLALDVLLIPRFGIEGAAAVNVVVQGAWVAVAVLYVRQTMNLRFPVGRVLRLVALAALGAAPAALVAALLPGLPGLVIGGGLGVATYAVLVYTTGVVDGDDLRALGLARLARDGVA